MNRISFLLDVDPEDKNHIYIDGQPLPGSRWLDWGDFLSSLERGGYWDILTCSCGYATCAGIKSVCVQCGDGVIAWRTYEPWPGASYCFDAQQMKRAVCKALEDLDWLHFFNCDEEECFCPCDKNTSYIPKYIHQARALLRRNKPARKLQSGSLPTLKLLGAICRGDRDAVAYWAGAGADVNHVSLLESYRIAQHSVIQTALTFAPRAERLPIIELLVKHGADVRHAARTCPDLMHDMLATGDLETCLHLSDQLSGTDYAVDFERRYLDSMSGLRMPELSFARR